MQERAISPHLINKETMDPIDVEAYFTWIFESYYKRIYNYASYRVNCHYTAEDLTSQIFEKTMKKIDTFSHGKAPFEVWLFAIARNVVNDYFRSEKRRRLFSLDGFKELVSGRKGPERLAIEGEVNDSLLQALEALSARERNLIALKFGAQLKNTEIAELLHITVDNVGVILYRSMKKLRKTLGSVELE
ncbi:sigma-70 family RNA polymerase sigma factor [Paenibacillus vulneris]|uniref:Sigma-70 family RNA polymerase sigma factor n=1 Tax=Paenibacillus vulneris TaxID=1133364 RepID=A0ABW3UQZ0_9BACL